MKLESITIISKRMKKKIRIADILYIIKSEYLSLIYLIDGDILQTITPIYELKEMRQSGNESCSVFFSEK